MNDHERHEKEKVWTCARPDIRRTEPPEKAGLGAAVTAVGLVVCLIGAVVWTLWGAL